MTALSNYAEDALLDHICGTTSMTAPTTIYAKLHTGAPGEDGTANAATETTRVDCGNFSAASSGATDNDSAITWTNVSTSETYSGISLWDNLTAGNCLWNGTFTGVAVTAGDDFEIGAGDLDLSLD